MCKVIGYSTLIRPQQLVNSQAFTGRLIGNTEHLREGLPGGQAMANLRSSLPHFGLKLLGRALLYSRTPF